MNRFFILIAVAAMISSSCSFTPKNVHNFVFEASNNDEDYTPKVIEVLRKDRDSNCSIEFKPGVYHFYPEKAIEKYVSVSNNDNGLRRFVFTLERRDNIHINGNGATFKFHGSTIPFLIEKSAKITIEGINIEYDFPFDFEGTVVANNEKDKTFDLQVDKANTFEIKDDILYFKGYDWEMGLGENIVYNPATKSPAYYTAKYEHDFKGHYLKAKALNENTIRFSNVHAEEVPPVGSIYSDKGPHGQNRNMWSA